MTSNAIPDRSYRGKRVADLALLGLLALPSLVVGGACAVAVRLTSRGPIFFRQERVGLGGRHFRVWKFRTMVDEPDLPIIPDESKITAAGRLLRRFSLDELPQLINVLRGEMSVVGPRPTLAYQVDRYDQEQLQRLSVRPGITGLAQIRGRNAIEWSDRIRHDLEYIRLQSPSLDIRIIATTAKTVLGGSGVSGHPLEDPMLGDAIDPDLGRDTGT